MTQPRINCGTSTWLKSKWKVRQGKNKACSPLFTLWSSPSCCKRCKNKKKVREKKHKHIYTHSLKYNVYKKQGYKRKSSSVEVWSVLRSQMCGLHSPSEWGACPGLTSCLFLSHTSERERAVQHSTAQHSTEWVSEGKRGASWQTRQRGKQNAATSSPVQSAKSDLSYRLAGAGEVFFKEKKLKKKTKLWLVSISSRCNETVSERRGFRAAVRGEAHIRCELWSGSWKEPTCDVNRFSSYSRLWHTLLWRAFFRMSCLQDERTRRGDVKGELTVSEVQSRNTDWGPHVQSQRWAMAPISQLRYETNKIIKWLKSEYGFKIVNN